MSGRSPSRPLGLDSQAKDAASPGTGRGFGATQLTAAGVALADGAGSTGSM